MTPLLLSRFASAFFTDNLTALGSCFLSTINRVVAAMRVDLSAANISLTWAGGTVGGRGVALFVFGGREFVAFVLTATVFAFCGGRVGAGVGGGLVRSARNFSAFCRLLSSWLASSRNFFKSPMARSLCCSAIKDCARQK